jgi:putative chitinase
MSPEQLKLMGVDEKWYEPLIATFTKYGISTTKRQAAFLGQCMHESGNFKRLEEDLHYSANALMRVWPSRFPDHDTADKYANNPEKIANKVYAGRMGNTEEGDGYKYRGRGVIQLTGKDSYLFCGSNLGIDTITHPELLLEPKWACLSAGWFWNRKNLNALADAGDIKEITRRVNGGMNGYAERVEKTALAQKALDTY